MTAEQLRNSILQEAVLGHLVPQNPVDEPASTLLERVRLARESLLREKKVKAKDIDSAPIQEDERTFELPAQWEFVRLNYVATIARGGSPRPIKEYLTDSPNGYNWIKIGDTEKGGKYINHTKERIKPEGLKKSRLIHKGDFLLTNSMSFGRPYISNIEGCIHDGWLVISPAFGEVFDKDYLYYVLSSPYVKDQFLGKVSGAVVQNLNSDKVATSVIPLPPLAEQKRIVAKLEELLPIVEQYGKAQTELDELNAALPARLRTSLLQEAMQGKLVPNDESEMPFTIFNSQIEARKQGEIKAKRLKKSDAVVKPITEDEIPFEIPSNWTWYRLSDLANMYTGDSINAEQKLKYYTNVKGMEYIATKDVKFDHKVDYANGVAIPDERRDKFRIAPAGSILLCVEGGSAGRKIATIDRDVCFGNKLCCFATYTDINPFLYYYLQSPMFKDVFRNSITGIIGGVAIKTLRDLLVPLPPLAEQERIVAKIEELFEQIDKISK